MNRMPPIPPRPNLPVKKRIMLQPQHILRFFIGQDVKLDDLIIFHHEKFQITTTDFALYQALGSIKEYDNFNKAKLVKFLEVTTVMPQRKKVLTHERVSQLRKIALKGDKPVKVDGTNNNQKENHTEDKQESSEKKEDSKTKDTN